MINVFMSHKNIDHSSISLFIEKSSALEHKSKFFVFNILGQSDRLQSDEQLRDQLVGVIKNEVVNKKSIAAREMINQLSSLGLRKNEFFEVANSIITKTCTRSSNNPTSKRVRQNEIGDLQSQARRMYNIQDLSVPMDCI